MEEHFLENPTAGDARAYNTEEQIATDLEQVDPAQERFENGLRSIRLPDGGQAWSDSDIMDMALGFREAVLNALIHGNMAIQASERDEVRDEIARRQHEFTEMTVTVELEASADSVRVTVRDQGRGFEVSAIEDPTTEHGRMKSTGRGYLIMKDSFDSVVYSDQGRTVTMLRDVEGEIADPDRDWKEQLPRRINPDDVAVATHADGSRRWHLKPHAIKDPELRAKYGHDGTHDA